MIVPAKASSKQASTKKRMGRNKKSALIFYWVMFALPLVQFCIFYIGVNFNSILLAFKNYTIVDRSVTTTWVGLDNFKKFFEMFGSDSSMWSLLGNSLIVCAVSIFVTIPLNLIFSYYIYRKYFGSKFFQVILFLPTIISEMVLVALFKVFASQVLTSVFKMPVNILDITGDYVFVTALVFSTFINFGAMTLVYSNAMSGINPAILEAAEIDGASPTRQFFSVVVPCIWPTIVSYIVIALVGLTSNQISLFSLFGDQMKDLGNANRNLAVWSYWLVMKNSASQANYPFASAVGLIMTAFIAPLSMIANHLLTKFGPSED